MKALVRGKVGFFLSSVETDKYFSFIYIDMYINLGVTGLFLVPKMMLIEAVSALGWFSRLFLKNIYYKTDL